MNTSNNLTIGIQGGPGSFNEEAIKKYLARSNRVNASIHYLHTTRDVLNALKKGTITLGQFAVRNSLGGEVAETIEALKYTKVAKVAAYDLKIVHTLMMRNDATIEKITTIMTHPQVLAQCKHTLAKKYPWIKLTSGRGELIDHALVAQQLSEKKLPVSVATIGSKVLAVLYSLTIIEENLQDNDENYTSFLLVKSV